MHFTVQCIVFYHVASKNTCLSLSIIITYFSYHQNYSQLFRVIKDPRIPVTHFFLSLSLVITKIIRFIEMDIFDIVTSRCLVLEGLVITTSNDNIACNHIMFRSFITICYVFIVFLKCPKRYKRC